MRALSFIALAVALFGIILNIQSGWSLSQNEFLPSDFHLLVAILTLVFTWIGGGLILVISSKAFEALRLQIADNKKTKDDLKRFNLKKDRSTQLAMASMALSLISLISGTISHGGRFPWLHGLLGFALAFSILLTLISWILFSESDA